MIVEIIIEWIDSFFRFLNSNFFVALITLLSVLVVIWVYKKQKNDEKVEAAKLLLVEIRDAENILENIKKNGINLIENRQINSTNSWKKFKHLFAKNFDEKSLKLIDNFYSQCELLNKELQEAYSLPIYWQDKARIIAEHHIAFSKESKSKEEYESKKKSLKFFESDIYWWQPDAPKTQMIQRVQLIENITSTKTGKKLKEISQVN